MGSAFVVGHYKCAAHAATYPECLTSNISHNEKDHSFCNAGCSGRQYSGGLVVVQLPHLQYSGHQFGDSAYHYIDVHHRMHHHERCLPRVSAFCVCFSWPCHVPADAILQASATRQLARDRIAHYYFSGSNSGVCDT